MVKKIDFHIHTVSSDKDDDFLYSSYWMKDYVKKAKLDAIAITNHNLFDQNNFDKVQEDLTDTVVFPGIELSLNKGHVNIIFPKEMKNELIIFSEWLKTKNLGKTGSIDTNEFCENLNGWEKGIYIFELGKSNSLSVPDKLQNVCSVGGVSNQLKFQAFYNMDIEGQLTPVLFSDAHATEKHTTGDKKRNDIDILKSKNTFLQIDNCTFNEIINCISKKDKVGINENHLNNIIDIENHTVSTGLNLIVGKRGTGKSEFLKTIEKQYETNDIYKIAQFETAKSDEFIDQQRREQGQSVFNEWKKKYDCQLSAIERYLECSVTEYDKEIDDFLDSIKKFAKDTNNSKSKSKYKLIRELNFEMMPLNNIEKYLNELKNLIDSSDFWSLLKKSQDNKKIFIEIYEELRINYINKKQNNKLKKEVNGIIDSIKKIIQTKTGITIISECNFSEIIQKDQTEKEINKFMHSVIKETSLKKENIYGYKIVVKLVPFKDASEFRRDISTKKGVQNDLIIPYKEEKYIKFLKNLKNKDFFEISKLADYFLHLEVKLLDSDDTPASGGQAVGFALMMRLKEAKNNPIVLIDEPEASLDNEYIREALIKSIKELSRDSTVFVVTHNSTLGTLLEPDYLIVTTKKNNEYHILSGEFSSHIISDNSKVTEKSYEKFVEAMEAGIKAYTKKGEIYENLNR